MEGPLQESMWECALLFSSMVQSSFLPDSSISVEIALFIKWR